MNTKIWIRNGIQVSMTVSHIFDGAYKSVLQCFVKEEHEFTGWTFKQNYFYLRDTDLGNFVPDPDPGKQII